MFCYYIYFERDNLAIFFDMTGWGKMSIWLGNYYRPLGYHFSRVTFRIRLSIQQQTKLFLSGESF